MCGHLLQAIRFTAANLLCCSCGDRFFSIGSSPRLPAPLQEQMSRRSATIHPNSSLGGQSRRRRLCHCHEKSTFVMSRRIIYKWSVAGSKKALICCPAVRGWGEGGGRKEGWDGGIKSHRCRSSAETCCPFFISVKNDNCNQIFLRRRRKCAITAVHIFTLMKGCTFKWLRFIIYCALPLYMQNC